RRPGLAGRVRGLPSRQRHAWRHVPQPVLDPLPGLQRPALPGYPRPDDLHQPARAAGRGEAVQLAAAAGRVEVLRHYPRVRRDRVLVRLTPARPERASTPGIQCRTVNQPTEPAVKVEVRERMAGTITGLYGTETDICRTGGSGGHGCCGRDHVDCRSSGG